MLKRRLNAKLFFTDFDSISGYFYELILFLTPISTSNLLSRNLELY
jgi:hypothetical protein